MTAAGRYLTGVVAVAAVAGSAVGLLFPPAWRGAGWLALGLALVLQAPLGLWLVASVGTARMPAVWVVGILARLLLVGVTGLVIVPWSGLDAAAVLIPLVVLLVAFVLLEGVVLMMQQSRIGSR